MSWLKPTLWVIALCSLACQREVSTFPYVEFQYQDTLFGPESLLLVDSLKMFKSTFLEDLSLVIPSTSRIRGTRLITSEKDTFYFPKHLTKFGYNNFIGVKQDHPVEHIYSFTTKDFSYSHFDFVFYKLDKRFRRLEEHRGTANLLPKSLFKSAYIHHYDKKLPAYIYQSMTEDCTYYFHITNKPGIILAKVKRSCADDALSFDLDSCPLMYHK